MNRGRVIISASLLAVMQSTAPAVAVPAATEEAACNLTKISVAERGRFPTSSIAFCDVIVPEEQPEGFYVLGVHGKREDCGDDICGSTLMGWFAVQKATGRVFEWDVADWKTGSPVKP